MKKQKLSVVKGVLISTIRRSHQKLTKIKKKEQNISVGIVKNITTSLIAQYQ